jgi:hypothetical protein
LGERERVRETERQTERQRDRETERQRDRETERQRDRETERGVDALRPCKRAKMGATPLSLTTPSIKCLYVTFSIKDTQHTNALPLC